ncbi:MAG: hypothetical protein OIN85_01060 [Candidatus Methanoperedens sp.]|nr:hypothetical protein [Candidatus Methanoperedens sp.]
MPIKSFLTKVGLVEDDIPVTKAKSAPAQSFASAPTPSPTKTYSPPAPEVDPSIQEMLQQSLQENKLSGFDYLKFVSAVEETRSTGVAEEARYKMTFSTAKQLGVGKDGLLKSGAHYLEVLEQDESDFNSDCAQYEKNEVQSRASKIATIESTIADLTTKLAQLNQDHTALTQELEEEKTKLESRRTAFRVTLESVRGTIRSNIDKINQYL